MTIFNKLKPFTKNLFIRIRHDFSLFIVMLQIVGIEIIADSNIYLIPVFHKYQNSIRLRIFFFSIVLILLIIVPGSTALIILYTLVRHRLKMVKKANGTGKKELSI